jgi:hypothetical protein
MMVLKNINNDFFREMSEVTKLPLKLCSQKVPICRKIISLNFVFNRQKKIHKKNFQKKI